MQLLATVLNSPIEVQWHLTCTRFDEWLKSDVFRFRWWFLLMVFIITAFVWWKLVDKSRLNEIILYTALIAIVALVLDELGEELALWDYPTDIIPLFPPISAIDLASLPIVYSLIFQYFKTWRRFIIATVIMALVFCLFLEPILVWGGIYQTLTWKYYYGFPIYIAMAISTRALVNKINSVFTRI